MPEPKMEQLPRKKSPRAPSAALDEAIERATRIYKAEHLNAVPADLVAMHLGFKSANSGPALSWFATLRYYGIMERRAEGTLSISKEFESYVYAPDDAMRKVILLGWLTRPPTFAALLSKYPERLPTDGVIKFDLIQMNFIPVAADSVVSVFRRSVEFVGYYSITSPQKPSLGEPEVEELVDPEDIDLDEPVDKSSGKKETDLPAVPQLQVLQRTITAIEPEDRIPVRLSGGRRAWIVVPSPFYKADKARLKAHIELLLADDEEAEE
jgi:hypothetical protein